LPGPKSAKSESKLFALFRRRWTGGLGFDLAIVKVWLSGRFSLLANLLACVLPLVLGLGNILPVCFGLKQGNWPEMERGERRKDLIFFGSNGAVWLGSRAWMVGMLLLRFLGAISRRG
jgi:hypothetical protein